MTRCGALDCRRPATTRGWCGMHYMRWVRNGDPLGGRKTLNGEPARFFREVVLPYDGDDCLQWPFARNEQGYGVMGADGRMQLVHRLICKEVIGPPLGPKYEAAHSCGNGSGGCCTKRHLSWKTRSENEHDKVAHSTSNRGERQWKSKLTEAQVLRIRALRGAQPQRKIAEQFGIRQQHVSRIQSGKDWFWLADEGRAS